jgi:hypothetical protein
MILSQPNQDTAMQKHSLSNSPSRSSAKTYDVHRMVMIFKKYLRILRSQLNDW